MVMRWAVVIPAKSWREAMEFTEILEGQAWGFMWKARPQKVSETWQKPSKKDREEYESK
jgi:hypothetical protein